MRYKTQDFSKLDTKLIDNAWSVFKDSATAGAKPRVLKLETIGTHSGKVINNRVYPGVHVKDAAKSFNVGQGTKFEKPFLLNHDRERDPIGRIKSGEYKQTATGKKFLNDHFDPSEEGSGFLKISSVITDQEAIEKFLDGRYQTVSISGSTTGAFCNLCSKERGEMHPMWDTWKVGDTEKECRHIPGKAYNDTKCHVITGALDYAELSQVNVPADNAAMHLAKTIAVADSLESSLWQFFDAASTLDIISTPARFGILDADGNPLQSLDTDTYKSTKTISIPPKTAIENSASGDCKSSITDEEFARLHVLKHFSDLGMLTLTDAQKEEVTKLKNSQLSETQSGILQDSFIIHPVVPFNIHDTHHYKAVLDLLNGGLNVDKERWKSAVDEAAKQHNIVKDNIMDLEALKKALADAQAKLTALEADVKAKDATIADTQKKLTEAEGKLKVIADAERQAVVAEVIALRTDLKLADTKDLADAAKKEATLKTLNDKFSALDITVLKMMSDDLKAMKATAVAAEVIDEEIANPLTQPPKAGEATTVADDKKAAAPDMKDLKPAQLL